MSTIIDLPSAVQGGRTRATILELSGGTEVLTWVGPTEIHANVGDCVRFSGWTYRVESCCNIITAKGSRTLIAAVRGEP